VSNRITLACSLAIVTAVTLGAALPASAARIPTAGLSPEQASALLEKRASKSRPFVPGEIIVKMKDGVPVGAMSAGELRRMQLEVKPAAISGGDIIYRLPPTIMGAMSASAQAERTLAAVEELRRRPEVLYAQPNYLVQIAATPNDTLYPAQWHYPQADLPAFWDITKGSSAVVVAVIDTGILKNHADIAGSPNLLPGFDMISDTAIANDGDGRDGDSTDPGDAVSANECGPGSPAQPSSWHGTHVAGTVGVVKTDNAAGIAGVNWQVKVLPVRVLGKCGGTMADINDAIRWAAGLPVPGVPNNTNKAKVINMSLGGAAPCTASPATQSAITDAINQGVTVVVAAGNEASDAAGFLPASCIGPITVAAGDFRGRLVTRYSNFGARVDLLAPGGDLQRDDDGDGNPDGVLSTVQGGYNYYNGTSMAAPHVAGAVALLIAEDSSRTPAQLLSLLKTRALPRSSTECPQPCGAGLLRLTGGGGTPTPPVLTISLTVTPDSFKKGQTATARAEVRRNGAPDANRPVTFMSADPATASVSPPGAMTDSAGMASATVTGVKKGTTGITAESQGKQDTKPVKVLPALPLGWLALFALAVLLGWAWPGFRQRRGAHAQ